MKENSKLELKEKILIKYGYKPTFEVEIYSLNTFEQLKAQIEETAEIKLRKF